MGWSLILITLLPLSLAEDLKGSMTMHAEAPKNIISVIDACKDVDGASHKLGDSYIGPDACNKCKCLESGSACTKYV